MTALEKRAAVVSQARSWLGRRQSDGSHRAIIDLYNSLRPPGSYRMTYDDPWCAAFVSAVGMAVGLGDVILPHVSCGGMIDMYRARGRWVEDDGYSPAPGDLIFYDWQDSGAGDCTGSPDHVGIVAESDARAVTVIEGNKGAEKNVAYRSVPRGGRYIRGFAVPEYGDEAGGDPSTPACASAQDDGVSTSSAADAAPSPQGEGKALCAALPVLSLGCRGRSVVVAQGILIALGCSCGPDGADGDFGANTRSAVRRFQRGAGLPENGVLDALTWAKLLGI